MNPACDMIGYVDVDEFHHKKLRIQQFGGASIQDPESGKMNS